MTRLNASNWPEVPLRECADITSGGTPTKGEPSYWGGDIPWVSAKDMKTFRLNDAQDHVTADGAAHGTRVAPAGATLILVRGMTLHDHVPICWLLHSSAFNQDVKAVVPKSSVEPEYLAYWLAASERRLHSKVDAAGHGTGRIAGPALASLPVRLPPLSEQRRIAAALGALDRKIELNRHMNRTLESIARAIFKSWFVDFEPVRKKMEGKTGGELGLLPSLAAHFPDGMRTSPAGLVPRGWSVSEIGREVTVVGGSTPSTKNSSYWGGDINFGTPKDLATLESPVLLRTARRITEAGAAEISSGILPAGTLLMSSRAPIGYLAIADTPVCVNQGFIAMVCNDSLPNEFVLQWARQHMDLIVGNANGTTFPEISKRSFRPLPILLPPRQLLAEFARLVVPIRGRVVRALRESESLSAARDALLPVLLSGDSPNDA